MRAGGAFSAGDGSDLKLDLRRRRGECQGRRERSFAGGHHRPRQGAGRATASEGRVLTLPTHSRSRWIQMAIPEAALRGPITATGGATDAGCARRQTGTGHAPGIRRASWHDARCRLPEPRLHRGHGNRLLKISVSGLRQPLHRQMQKLPLKDHARSAHRGCAHVLAPGASRTGNAAPMDRRPRPGLSRPAPR